MAHHGCMDPAHAAHIGLPDREEGKGMAHIQRRTPPRIGIYPVKGINLLGCQGLYTVIGVVPVKGSLVKAIYS